MVLSATNQKQPQSKKSPLKSVRIIGGSARSRRIYFCPRPQLRPTGDRVRETLFNWLEPSIRGRVALDLFCGSGVLGFESLSRGATHCQFIDQDPVVKHHIRKNVHALGWEDRCQFHQQEVISWLRKNKAVIYASQLIFCDPPFQGSLSDIVLAQLQEAVQIGTILYVEKEKNNAEFTDQYSSAWQIIKHKAIAQVTMTLLKKVG